MRKVLTIIMIGWVMVSAAAGQTGGDRSAGIEQLGQFIEEDTYAILHVDLQKVNSKAIFDKFVEVGQWEKQSEYYQQVEAISQMIGLRIDTFRQAGGQDLYAIFSGVDFPRFFMLVGVKEQADNLTLSRIIKDTCQEIYIANDFVQYQTGGFIVLGLAETIQRIKTIKPALRPEVAQALAAVDEATVQLIFVPGADQQQVLEEMLPMMYQEFATMPAGSITKGMQRLTLGINLPPEMTFKIMIHSEDIKSAAALNLVITKFFNKLMEKAKIQQLYPELLPQLETLLEKLNPRVEKEFQGLILELDNQATDDLTKNLVTPLLVRARELARRVQCASNLGAVARSIVMYQNDYKQMPPNLQILCKTEILDPRSLICPSSGDKAGDCSYVYRGSDLPINALFDCIVAYDKSENHQGECRNVLFHNSSIKRMTEQEFQQGIALDNKLRKEKGLPEKPIK